jgi:Tat protein secretion system quality control protein TatD with DNase activity
VRGRPNEPANVLHTLAVVASARGEDQEELGHKVDANAAALFGLP